MPPGAAAVSADLDPLYRDLRAAHLYPLWRMERDLLTAHPKPLAVPWVWRAAEMYPLGDAIFYEQYPQYAQPAAERNRPKLQFAGSPGRYSAGQGATVAARPEPVRAVGRACAARARPVPGRGASVRLAILEGLRLGVVSGEEVTDVTRALPGDTLRVRISRLGEMEVGVR